MKLDINIEKSGSGLFSAYAVSPIDDFFLAGYGESVDQAVEDLKISLKTMNEMRVESGHPPIDGIEFEFKYDVASFFNKFDFLNISKFAALAGINPSLMRQYASGLAKAGQKQYEKIRAAYSGIVADLNSVRF